MSDSSGMGCFAKGCLVAIVICALIIGGVYYAIFHTALPANLVVKAITANPALSVEGVSGSLASGFAVKAVRYKHADGNESRVDDVAFRYRGSGGKFTVENIQVKSAHLFHDWDAAASNNTDSVTTTTWNSGNGTAESGTFEGVLFIKKVDVNDITVENPTSGDKLYLKTISLAGLQFSQDEVKMGRLKVASDNLLIEIDPKDPGTDGMGTSVAISGLVGKKLHASILKDIKFKGEVDFDLFPGTFASFNGFDGHITVKSKDGGKLQQVTVKSFTPSEYVEHAHVFPVEGINLSAVVRVEDRDTATLEIVSGDFRIGGESFVVDEATIKMSEDGEGQQITAKSGKFTLTAREENGDGILELTSDPELSSRESLALMVYGSKYAELASEEQASVDAWVDVYFKN